MGAREFTGLGQARAEDAGNRVFLEINIKGTLAADAVIVIFTLDPIGRDDIVFQGP